MAVMLANGALGKEPQPITYSAHKDEDWAWGVITSDGVPLTHHGLSEGKANLLAKRMTEVAPAFTSGIGALNWLTSRDPVSKRHNRGLIDDAF